MKILFDIGHPKHVHLFKNIIRNLQARGHIVKITSRDKDCALRLLNTFGFEYSNMGEPRRGLINKLLGIVRFDYRLLQIAKEFKPDIFVSKGSPYAAHSSRIMRKPHIAFKDTEHAKFSDFLTLPFTDYICTPACFKRQLDPKKHIRFNGYYELAYLHPNYFKPNPSVVDELQLSRDERFFVLRFVSWEASHDVGYHGFTDQEGFIKKLREYGRVLITSERPLNKGLEEYRVYISPEKMHDLLYYATMYIGEGATMATEAGILGTPAVYISSLVGTMGNFDELEQHYGLVYSFKDQASATDKITSLLENKNLVGEWIEKREKLLNEKIDVTSWMTDLIENYPMSVKDYFEGVNSR